MLSFEDDLGFLNAAIDLNDLSSGGIDLPSDGSWVPTAELCFLVNQSVFDNPSECIEIIWARDGMTNEYAVSFVEISRWVSSNNTENAVGTVYDDLDSSDGETSCLEVACGAQTI